MMHRLRNVTEDENMEKQSEGTEFSRRLKMRGGIGEKRTITEQYILDLLKRQEYKKVSTYILVGLLRSGGGGYMARYVA
jgi:hypothetical protein